MKYFLLLLSTVAAAVLFGTQDVLAWLSGPLVIGLSADIDDLYRELKNETFIELWTKGSALVNRIMGGARKVQVNTRAYLIPRWTSFAGDARSQTFDAAAYTNGTNGFTDMPSVSSIGSSVSHSATELMQMASRSDRVATRNYMADFNARCIQAHKEHMECWLNANSNDGIMSILSGVQNTTEYILNSVDDRYRGYLLIDGATYQIIASAAFPGTIRATGPYRVLADGNGTNKRLSPSIVQFGASNAGETAAAITGFVAEDRVVVFGGGNAWYNSIPHLVSSAATGTVQGVSRALPHNRPTRIDGGGAVLDAALFTRLYADIYKYKGALSAVDGLVPYCSQDQVVNLKNSAQAVSEIRLTDAGGASVGEIYDRFLGGVDEVKVNKKKPLISNRANPEQFRLIRLADFLWVTMQDIGFKKNVAGGVMHEQHNGDGDLLSAFSAHTTYHGNLAFEDVSSMGVLYNLSVPALGI